MEATAAISLLFAHQSGLLNTAVDAIVPVYTLAVLCLLVTIHWQQQGSSSSPSSLPSSSSDEAYLVAFEQDLLRAAKAKEEQQQQQQQQQQREQEKQKRKAEASKKGEEGRGKEETKEGGNEGGAEEGPDFSGVWKSVPSKNSNYDEFLTVQGVPYLKRKIANSTVVTHTIQQEGDILKLEVQPLDMKATFHIGGPPSTSYIGKTLFEDTMTRSNDGDLILVKKNEKDGMEITAVRSLKEGGKVLVMKQCVKNLKDGKETHAEQTFEKAG